MGLDIDLYTPKIDIGDDGADDIIIEITGLKSISKFIGLEDTPLYYDNGKFFKVEDNKIVYTDIEWKDISGNLEDAPEIVTLIENLIEEISTKVVDNHIYLHNIAIDAHPYIQNIIHENYVTLDTKIDDTKEELSQDISNLNDALNQEISDRETADNALLEDIQEEILARIEGDTTLQDEIDTLNTNLQNEIDARIESDTNLSNSLDELSNSLIQEVLDRQEQDGILQEQITSNYNTLDDKIDTEISNRISADTTLQNNINAEASTRQNADTTLQGNIDTLSDTVSDNYTDLDGKISDLTNTVNDNDTAINSKVDGINTTLTTTINNLSNTVSSNYTTLDTKIDNTKTSLEGNISDLSNTVNQNYTDLSNAITTSASTINSRIDSEVSTLNTAIGTETTNRQNADNNLQSQIDAIVSSSDVFDIVGTYAELQAYDISTVPVNDIIKVLVDSSHDNAATYYRCIETAGVKSWSYIGSEGAYYTKSESDTKFVAKTTTINNKPLSSNITLTASDVNALPNTTIIGDGILTLQKNGVNIDTFNANATANKSINITVPTDTADLTNGAEFITASSLPIVNNGTLTIQANGITVGTFTANQAGNTTANIVVPDSATWGNITGTLSNQTDLQNALNAKQDVLTSANAGNCIQIVSGGSSGLPAEYQEVEYLQSSGTQYIDTGVVLDDTMTIRIKYDFIRSGFVFGSRVSASSRYSGITNEGGGAYNIRYGNTVIYTQNTAPFGTVDVVISPNGVTLNGEEVSTTAYGDSFYAGNCYLFTSNSNGVPFTGDYATNRVRRFTIDNVIDLVPCKRKSDDVLGMYDLINDEFLTNAGTGTFLTGGNVEEITKISFVNNAGYITGITSSDVTTALGYTPYNSSNPDGYITSADLPTNHVTTDTAQTISADKTFTGVTKFQNGSAEGCVILGADASNTTVSNNTRKLGRMIFHTQENTVNCAFVSTDSQSSINYVEFGGRIGDTTNTSPDRINFTIAKTHNTTTNSEKQLALSITPNGADFTVQPTYNNVNLATETWVTNQGYLTSVPTATASSLGVVKPDGTTITIDANGVISGASQGANTDLSNLSVTGEAHFQVPLVSGTNIKTINNQSLLGSGNIDIQGGGGSAPEWGNITGTISNQTDLQNALDGKQNTLIAGDNIEITDNGLPNIYDRLSYIESTGIEYLIAPYKVNNKTKLYCRYKKLGNGGVSGQSISAVIGVTTSVSPSVANFGIFRGVPSGGNFNRVGWGDDTTNSIRNITGYDTVGTWYELYFDLNEIYIDNTLVATSTTDPSTVWEAEYDLGIFARNSSTAEKPFYGQISSVWAKEDDIYVLNLIPCKRKSDSIVGMYDTVSKTFLTNQNDTGAFVAGDIIPVSGDQVISFVGDAFTANEVQAIWEAN